MIAIVMTVSIRARGGIRLPGPHRPLTPLRGSLLLARGKRAIELAIYQEVGQDPTWAPRDAIGPSFDAGGSFFVDEHIPADDEGVALPVVRSTNTMGQQALESGLEDNQGVFGGLDVSPPGRDTGGSSSRGAHNGIKVTDGGSKSFFGGDPAVMKEVGR